MTGSTLGLVITPIVTVIVLAAWLILVFYADAHPAWRRKASAERGTAGPVTPAAAGGPEESQHSPRQEATASPAAGRDSGARGQRAAGTDPDKAKAA
jgi:hypothetical protein